jgi:hypothetical protein
LLRAKLLAVLDRAYDRLAFAENDTASLDALRELFAEMRSSLKVVIPKEDAVLKLLAPDEMAEIEKRMRASLQQKRSNSAANAVQN